MAEPLILWGYGPSVYTRIVRIALVEMGLTATYVEVNPFADSPDPELLSLNPIGRVPVLKHGDFVLSETGAILRYLDQVFASPSLVPADPLAAARMAQVIGIVDAHLYVPLVRKAFAYGYKAPEVGLTYDPKICAEGIATAHPALSTLDRISAEGLQLSDASISLADLHLAPMIDYGLRVPEVRAACAVYPALLKWWDRISQRPSVVATDPIGAR